jgi:DNA invertase Pin-like site-specific DNA recombinase
MRRRMAATMLAGLLALSGLSGVPALAQDREQTPTDLWDEYPLEERSPEPDSSVPDSETSPPPGQGERAASPAAAGDEDGGGSSVLPIAAGGVALLGGAPVVLWILAGRSRARKEQDPAPQPRPLVLAPAPGDSENGAGRAAANGAGSETERQREAERPADRPVVAAESPAETPAPEKASSPKPFRGRPVPVAAPEARPSVNAVGYTTVRDGDETKSQRLREEARQIQAACKRHGLALRKLVRDLEPQSGPDMRRPGLTYALESLEAGVFECLVVPRLDRLTRSAANLGALIRLLDERNARLIVVDIDLDTDTEEGRIAADALVKVGGLERTRLEQRTRKGLEAARVGRRSSGRPAVADRPSLKQRIADMRASGMTLQAIADTLNDEGVPTVRGGAEWRPSSVQAAAGYKRPSRRSRTGGSPPKKR